jgi:hypothetical protein
MNKRSCAADDAGIDNPLFCKPGTKMRSATARTRSKGRRGAVFLTYSGEMRVALLLIALTSIASADGVRVTGTSLTLQRGADKPIALHIAKSAAKQPSTSHPCTLNIRLAPNDVPFQSFDFSLDVMEKDSQGPRSFQARTNRGVNVAAKRGGVTRFIQGEKSSVLVDGTVEVDGMEWRLRGRITVADIDCAWD